MPINHNFSVSMLFSTVSWVEGTNENVLQICVAKIVKLLIEHVVRGDFWVPTKGSPPCWWWGYQSAVCIHDWFEMGCHFSPGLIQLG